MFSLFYSIFLATLLCVSVFCIEKSRIERKRNPIPKTNNSDKRFSEVEGDFVHDIFSVKRGC